MTVDVATLAIRINSLEARNAARDMDRMRESGGRAEQQTNALESASRKLAGALALLGIGAGIGSIIKMADEYTKFSAQIRLATRSQTEYNQAMEDVRRISTAAQQDLGSTGTLYARIANSLREMGKSQKQVSDITETVNLALAVSGATASEAASAQLQLSQAFASGVLRGEEFNAVNEAAPRLMKALADGMGVPIGALRNMATEGKITSQIMAEVLPNALEKVREEAKKVQTIGGSFTVFRNSIVELVGVQAQASGAVSNINTALTTLAANMRTIVEVALLVAAVYGGRMLAAFVESTKIKIRDAAASIEQSKANQLAAQSAVSRASAEQQAALIGQSNARAKTIQVKAEVADERLRAAATAAASEQSIAARQAQYVATAQLIRQEMALEQTRLAAQINSIGRAQRVAEMAKLGAQITAIDRAVAAQNTALTAVRVANEQASANAATAGAARIVAAREAETVAAGASAAATMGLRNANAAAATATTAASAAGRVGAGVLAALGGPIGIVVTALTLGATAWMLWGNKAKEGSEKAANSFRENQDKVLKGLDEELEKQRALLKLKGQGVPVAQADKELPVTKQIDATKALLADMEKTMMPKAGQSLKEFSDEYTKLRAELKFYEEGLVESRQNELAINKQTVDERVKGLRKDMATNAEKMAAELKGIEDLKGKTADYDDLVARIRKKYADKGAASALTQEETAYKTLITNIKEKIAANELEMAGYNQLTDSQKLAIKLDAEVATGKTKLNPGDIERARALIAVVAATDGVIASNKLAAEGLAGFTKMQKDHDDQVAKTLLAAQDEAAKNEELVLTYGMSKAAIEQMELARLESQYAQRVSNALTQQEIADLEALIAAKQRNVAAVTKIEALDTGSDVAKAKELLDILVAVDNAAKSAAQGMAASFGTVGTAIGGLTTALTDYAVQQQAVAAQLAAVKADPKSSADKIAKAEMAASKASAQAQIKSYGDMANASKGFFKENSKGYKALEATERAFRAFEMAMAIESMVRKVFAIGAVTTATVTGEGVKTAAVAAGTAAQVAADTVKGTSAAAVAVATQAQGDPYSAWARMAAMVAAMAALGFAVAGGGGSDKSLSQQRQETQGTGTVFGDSTAKSDSIKRSLELVAGNSNIELSYTQGMLAALRNIESSLSGLGNVLVRNSGLTSSTVAGTGSSAQEAFMFMQPFWSIGAKSVGNLVGKIFGGKTTVEDTCFKIDPTTLGAGMAGNLNSFQYTDIKKSGGWFSSDDWDTKWNALGGAADAQFAAVLKGLGGSVAEAAKLLGLGGDAFTQRLNGFVIDIGKISLKGMSSEEIQKTLESVFSKLGDDLASYAVAGLDVFAQIGEGPLETLTRIAANYANLDSILASSGTSFGQVGMSSIAARERLIALAGGIDELASAQASFNDNFLTEAERLAPVQKYVTDQLAAMGLQSLDTRDKFKDYVLGLANGGKLATESGAAQYTALLALADAFAKTHAATVDLSKSEQEIADQRTDLQNQLDELTMTQAQLAAKARKEIAAGNLPLYDELTARKALATAYETESTAITSTIDKLKTFATAIKTFRDGLVLGNLSTLTLAEKAAAARDQYSTTLGAARGGDATAQSGLSAAATAFLTASQAGAASRLDYVRDYARVQADMAILAASVGSQLTDAEKQQVALDKQVKGLNTLNDSVNAGAATVAQAIASLGVLGVKQIDGSHAGGLSRVPFDGYTAELHAGERVLTAFEAREYSARSSGGGTGDVAAAIDRLTEENRALRAELTEFKSQSQAADVSMAQSLGKVARLAQRWDENGLLVRADEPLPTKETVTP